MKFNLKDFCSQNLINFLISFSAINYYFIHCLGVNTFSMGAFEDKGWGSALTIITILATEFFVLWHLFREPKFINKLSWGCLAYILEIYALREADFHRTFTIMNVTKSKFFKSAEIPVIQKIIAGTILLLFAIALIYLLVRFSKTIVKNILNGTPWAVSIAFWGIIIVGSRILDKSILNKSPDIRIKNIEEMMEITGAIYALTAIILWTLCKLKEKNEYKRDE